MVLFVHYDDHLMEAIFSNIGPAYLLDPLQMFNSIPTTNEMSYVNTDELSMNADKHVHDRPESVIEGSAINAMVGQELPMVDLDSHSITDSTHELI